MSLTNYLTHLRKLCETATKGPWVVDQLPEMTPMPMNGFITSSIRSVENQPVFAAVHLCKPVDVNNALLMATSRTALPNLLDALEVAVEALEEIEKKSYFAGDLESLELDWINRRAKQALAEVEAMMGEK